MADIIFDVLTAFEGGVKNVFLTSDDDCNALLPLLKERFDRVMYFVYDRDRYIDKSRFSIDTILKKSLMQPYIERAAADNCDYLLTFEKDLDKNTLVVIDGYDIPAPSPYLRHLMKTDCRLFVVGKNKFSGQFENTLILESECSEAVDLNNLTACQKELAMTLSAILFHLPNGAEFDTKTLDTYLGTLSSNLDFLVESGLVTKSRDGKISMKKRHIKAVMEAFKPTAQSCPSFMRFCEKACSFEINQTAKNNLSRLQTQGNCDIAMSCAFYHAYTHFSLTDKNKGIKLYNMLMSMTLDKKSFHSLRNKDFYLSTLKTELENGLADTLYDSFIVDKKDNYCEFRKNAKAMLDLIRICVAMLFGVTGELYKENKPVFDVLSVCLNEIYTEAQNISDLSQRQSLVDEAIKLCSSLFDYSEAISKKGDYNKYRDAVPTALHRCLGQQACDKDYAVSLNMAYSADIIRLYGLYQRLLDDYLCIDKKLPPDKNSLVRSIHQNKSSDRAEISKSISRTFCRIEKTYHSFFEFYSPGFENIKLYELSFDKAFDKKLEDNRRYILRGFDGGTKIGAQAYAESIMKLIGFVKNPLPYIRLVLADDFPVSDECYRQLDKKGFCLFVANALNISDREKMYLALELCENYPLLASNSGLGAVYIKLITSILEKYRLPDTVMQNLCEAVCSMYVECFVYDKDMSFAESLYKDLGIIGSKNDMTSSRYIARVLYAKNADLQVKVDRQKLSVAINLFEKELLLNGQKINNDKLKNLI